MNNQFASSIFFKLYWSMYKSLIVCRRSYIYFVIGIDCEKENFEKNRIFVEKKGIRGWPIRRWNTSYGGRWVAGSSLSSFMLSSVNDSCPMCSHYQINLTLFKNFSLKLPNVSQFNELKPFFTWWNMFYLVQKWCKVFQRKGKFPK